MRKLTLISFALAGCLGSAPQPDPSSNPAPVSDQSSTQTQPVDQTLGIAPTTSSADPSNTFNHESNQVDPFAVLARIQAEGPPEVSSRLHSCEKMKYATLGNLLTQLGVNLGSTAQNGAPPTAGDLYNGGPQAMGAPNYGARVPETIELTTAGATKLFDIFVSAAPEIIASIAAGNACKKGGMAGTAVKLFDASGKLTLDGIACLTGAPATQVQADLANQALGEASTPALGQTIAVATILSAAHTCE